MTVAELIEFLRMQPQDMLVAVEKYSEYCLVEHDEIQQIECCEPRADGWIHRGRPDRKTQTILVFPGN